jgi:hypothetical protein
LTARIKKGSIISKKNPRKPAIEFINEIFNPEDKIEKQIMKIEKKLDQVLEYARTTIGSSDVNLYVCRQWEMR